MADEPLISEKDAARLLGLSRRTLQDWRLCGTVNLPVVRLGAAIRYRPRDITQFIERNLVPSKARPSAKACELSK
jgi:predicted DNA-binding transcriptional regulator AlpA